MKEAVIELAGLRFSSNRAYGGEGEIKILAEDIRLNGLINPITVKPSKEEAEEDGDVFTVVAGRRRVQAATKLGWKAIACRVLEGDEIERAGEIAGAENINRLSMHPLDEAAVFQKLLENGEAAGELAKRFDRSVSAIWQRVQLLSLSDGIKELFIDGKITLHAAAMLKSLDQEQQSAFYDKFKKDVNIPLWNVKSFISKVRHDKLYTCVAGKDCAGCGKRTFYNDKTLFPELKDEDDLCLDHECYMGKWRKLLSVKIQKIKTENKSHEEADIIMCDDDDLAKIFGKSLFIDGTEFAVEKTAWDNRLNDKPDKTSKPCFLIDLKNNHNDEDVRGQTLSCVPLYWKENAQKEKEQKENPFMPMVKLLELPEDEAKQTADALLDEYKTEHSWETSQKARDIQETVRNNVLNRLINIRVTKPDNESDIDLFLYAFMAETNDKDVIKRFTGSEDIQDIKKLSVPRMFAALHASTLNEWDIPDFDDIDGEESNEVADWAGVNMSRLREMYREELQVLMPKPVRQGNGKNEN